MEFKHYKDKFKEIEFERYVGTIGLFFKFWFFQFILHKEHFKNSFFAFLVKP